MDSLPVPPERPAPPDVAAPLSRHLRFAHLFPAGRPLRLQAGGTLSDVRVAYEEYGTPAPSGDNTVFVCHALTGDAHPARHDPEDLPGWWEPMIGPGRPIDTDHFHVVCANVLGGCAGTTGPRTPGPDGRPYGPDFPAVTMSDMVRVHRELLAHLGVGRLHAVVGGSLGGMQALEWLLRHPGDAAGFVLVATAAALTTDNLAFSAVGRAAIRSDARFAQGRYAEDPDNPGPVDGLGVARMLAHLTYMSAESLDAKFGRRFQPVPDGTGAARGPFAVERYLEHQAGKLVARFDANSYLTLTAAMDAYDAFARPHALVPGATPDVHLVSFASDRLFGPQATRELDERLTAAGLTVTRYHDTTSAAGHDAFLLDEPGYLAHMATLFRLPARVPAG
ncbi:homoserine O-acetyltransferase [Streptomyces sp. NPDC017082]|uniref:homoserine O-acetyltransferase MetX n=1 Tax=Streptomyces sp. NPDC017082 TaxID=3364974 RepID=UPI0037AB6346